VKTNFRAFQKIQRIGARCGLAFFLLAGVLFNPGSIPASIAAAHINLAGPAGSSAFGGAITVLTSGNFVVADPGYNAPGPVTAVGAVYLYNGATGALISTLTGSNANDQVGSDGVVALPNGNFVVASPDWDHATLANVGAVTWGSGWSGVNGTVSEANSLIGSSAGDRIGLGGLITPLNNGNYVVSSQYWANGTTVDAGAVTWGNGATGIAGLVSMTNSLVGSSAEDQVGSGGVKALSNGNYLVISSNWDHATATNAGAVTWGNGLTGVHGAVSIANSLTGSSANDQAGSNGVTLLAKGNFVVLSPNWHNASSAKVGAETWGSSTLGVSGNVSAGNSLVGSTDQDMVGLIEVKALRNGSYVAVNPYWKNGSAYSAGAVTWGSGTTGVKGVISPSNSLVGSSPMDCIGYNCTENYRGITELANGNFVVASPNWNSSAGAVTWGSGTSGITGVVSAANSLVGSTPDDMVGSFGACVTCSYGPKNGPITVLTNGNYVVRSPNWDNGPATDAGAVSWGNGTSGVKGAVSAANSLVGSSLYDELGGNDVTVLTNGNYVVGTMGWDSGSLLSAGAATWGNGTTGISGTISAANSLVGSSDSDNVGYVTALTNGNYVVSSDWHSGSIEGAATWGNGVTGIHGTISADNSLVGGHAGLVTALTNGNYVVISGGWDSATHNRSGAVTWGNGATGSHGEVSEANSLFGSKVGDYVGRDGVIALKNGNYLVLSSYWANGAAMYAGAVTWGSGTSGVSGPVSEANSLVGSSEDDWVGSNCNYDCVIELNNGNYIVASPTWNNGAEYVGAVTWGDGTKGVHGAVSPSNSLVGSTAHDLVGGTDDYPHSWDGVTALIGGDYVVQSPYWDQGVTADSGAITPGSGLNCSAGSTVGTLTAANSALGTAAGGGLLMRFVYDPVNHQIVVGMPADNSISLLRFNSCAYQTFLPVTIK